MGCNGSKDAPPKTITEAPPKPRPTYGRRTDLDPRDFRVEGLNGKAILRKPGEVSGQVFDIDGCTDCDFWLFDHTEQIQIDNCKGCRFFIGACCASIFIRDCKDCDLEVGCKQFRARDCKNVRVLLFASTRPVIETSSNFQFGCFRGSYFDHAAHLDTARLSVWNNTWGEVHDFTRGAAPRANWKPLPWDVECEGLLPAFPADIVEEVGVMEDQVTVPVTYYGRDLGGSDNPAFVLFLLSDARDAMSLIEKFRMPSKPRKPCAVKPENVLSLASKTVGGASASRVAGGGGGASGSGEHPEGPAEADLEPTAVTVPGDSAAGAGAADSESAESKTKDKSKLPPPCAPDAEEGMPRRRRKKKEEALPIVLLRTRAQILTKDQLAELVPKSGKAFSKECMKQDGRVIGIQYSGERALAEVTAWYKGAGMPPTACWFAGPDSRKAATSFFIDFAPKV